MPRIGSFQVSYDVRVWALAFRPNRVSRPMFNDFSKVYETGARSLLDGDLETARYELAHVPTWQAAPNAIRHVRAVPPSRQVAVFKRDHFVCRYCGRRAVFVPTLRLLSMTFPDVLPYHPHGLMTAAHLSYWRDIASCDHLVPLARLGGSQADNLITACYLCNSVKQNWLIEELRWELRPIPNATDWDGLSVIYPDLLKRALAQCADASKPYFGIWLRALAS